MALLFGYSSSVQEDDIDMDGNRIVDPSPTSHTEPVTKYISHDVTKEMFQNNMHFCDDVCDKKFDIKLRKKRRWCPMQVIGFIAFGRVLRGVDVIGLLAKWVPNYRAQFGGLLCIGGYC